jgi:hypothetical protein
MLNEARKKFTANLTEKLVGVNQWITCLYMLLQSLKTWTKTLLYSLRLTFWPGIAMVRIIKSALYLDLTCATISLLLCSNDLKFSSSSPNICLMNVSDGVWPRAGNTHPRSSRADASRLYILDCVAVAVDMIELSSAVASSCFGTTSRARLTGSGLPGPATLKILSVQWFRSSTKLPT